MGSLFTFVALIAITGIAAAGYYLYTRTHSNTPLFTPRVRRLALIERAHLDGGRKLLLVRRDGVEHLILVGGPIDLVIETGIKPKELANGAAAEHSFAGAGSPGAPSLSLSPDTKETAEKNWELEPTPLQEVEASK